MPATTNPSSSPSTFADRSQRIRIIRHLMGAISSLMVILVVYLFAALGLAPSGAAHRFAGGTVAISVVLFFCFRTGLNKRFADPSLTTVQLVCAGIMVSYLAYHAPAVRALLIPFYMTALLFGTFRLRTVQLLAMSAFYIAAHGLATATSLPPGTRWFAPAMAGEWAQFLALAVILTWFSWMGGYVGSLRAKLRATNDELKNALEKIEIVASYDELTGLCNRRTIRDLLEREKKRCDLRCDGLCVALLDLDHFKRVNDTYGHAAGDEVLKRLADIMRSTLRDSDAAGRWGGEEFLIVFPHTTLEQTRRPLERIRETMAAQPLPGSPTRSGVTVSLGVAEYRTGEPVDALIGRADVALYQAKADGRNRLVMGPAAAA